jgi:hypothetical protein
MPLCGSFSNSEWMLYMLHAGDSIVDALTSGFLAYPKLAIRLDSSHELV